MSKKSPYYYEPQVRARNFELSVDLVVYGATSGGVSAAVHAARRGKKVVLLAFGHHVGGLTSAGLGRTDYGRRDAYGGLALEFYRRVGEYYGEKEAWYFEPSVASKVFRDLMQESNLQFFQHQALSGVIKEGGRLVALKTEAGGCFRAAMFIDASYEGDLMAAAGVSFTVGRESNEQYGEQFNGIHFGHPNHNFRVFVDPYRTPGKPSSGLLPNIQDVAPGRQGEGDSCVQAYNFRMCLSRNPANRIAFACPPDYEPENYSLLARYLEAGIWDALRLSHWLRPEKPDKSDTNNFGGFSSDYIGMNHAWPTASYVEREKIFQQHVRYTMGLHYFLHNDPRVPEDIRQEVSVLGLPADEFPETGGWPPELYVREARRMVGDYVMTEQECVGQRSVPDPVGLGAYQMDSHHCRRLALHGRVVNEGNVEIWVAKPYGISYRSVIPKRAECENLLVPWCLSASHIAFGSIRMEPVFMTLAQSCAEAACLALELGQAVQDLSYEKLKSALLLHQIPLSWKGPSRLVHGGLDHTKS
ncbi:MAG: FAD-dependent oxidoreductase [Blastochloris sp.]|nr:FAD-dependent oxidoreductase [Blastochloris sp.]